jgi:hypothetical protein
LKNNYLKLSENKVTSSLYWRLPGEGWRKYENCWKEEYTTEATIRMQPRKQQNERVD